MNNLTKNYPRLVWASALYDILVTLPFAFPVISAWQLTFYANLHQQLGFSGEFPLFEPTHLFFVNLMGSVVLVWSLLRMARPEPIYGLADGLTRLLFSAWMVIYMLFYGVSGLLWLFFVPELSWGIVQLVGYALLPHSARGGVVKVAPSAG